MDQSSHIRTYALSTLAFDAVGFAAAGRLEAEGARLEEWLGRGYEGSMAWMARNVDVRTDVRRLLPSARTVIVVARNYYTPFVHAPHAAKISRYAWGRDYHKILPKKLRDLARYIETLHPGSEHRWFVDTAPVMEKAWAVRAGMGWMGKHTNVITRERGSWVFLGVLLTSVELSPDDPIPDFCGNCTRCIDACPTEAIVAPYVLDASRCISYITIEQKPKEEIRSELAARLDGWMFGCDVCQDVCPWNRFQQSTDEPGFQPRSGIVELTAEEAARLTDAEFDERFQGSPVRRATADGFRRNARALVGR